MKSLIERSLYIIIAIVFTLLMLFILLYALDKNSLYKIGHKVPVINKILPDPTTPDKTDEQTTIKNQKDLIADLNDKVKNQTSQLAKIQKDLKDKEASLADLQKQLTSKKEEPIKGPTGPTDADLKLQLQQTAGIYAKMTAKKAAPILESMKMSERVMMLSMMNTDSRTSIMEKMTPKVAADTTTVLQKAVIAKEQPIKDLEALVKLLSKEYDNPTKKRITKDDVASTFAKMTPKNAADVLVQLAGVDEDKAVEILNLMDTTSRAAVMDAMATVNKEIAATLTARIGK